MLLKQFDAALSSPRRNPCRRPGNVPPFRLLFFGREQLVELKHVACVRILRFFNRLAVGHDPHDRFTHVLRVPEDLDCVVVRLRHLLPVDARHNRHVVPDARLGNLEDLAILVIELDGDIARHLDMLFLVAANRHDIRLFTPGCPPPSAPGRRTSAWLAAMPLANLVLVGMAALQQPHRRHVDSSQVSSVTSGHIALPVKSRAFRIQPAGQKIQRHIHGRLAQHFGIATLCQGMVVRDEQKRLALLLELQGRLHHAEVVADVQFTRWLYTRKNSHKSCLFK